jgi:hypothetical protein
MKATQLMQFDPNLHHFLSVFSLALRHIPRAFASHDQRGIGPIVGFYLRLIA